LSSEYLKDILRERRIMSLEDAIFRNCDHFIPANLKNHLPFWEHNILKDHPHKEAILNGFKEFV